MASWQAHTMSFLLRHTLKRQLRKADGNPAGLRRAMAAAKFRVPSYLEITPDQVGGVPGEWVQVRGTKVEATMLYLHGGGYFAGSPVTHRPMSCWFAKVGMRVFVPDYRLAPENPFPAAVEDARAVMAAMIEELGEEPLLIAGDSAGGGLALAAMVAERDAGHRLPVAALLFSPWTDLAVTGDSVKRNSRRCAMFTADLIPLGAETYLAGADPRTPLASPLYANLDDLPPLLIHASESECLLDDSQRLATMAQAQGVEVTLKTWPVVPHVWQLFYSFIPESRQSLAEATRFAMRAVEQTRVKSSASTPATV